MILVVLGTQDKQFPRLLEAVDEAISAGFIKEKVVVQAGQTVYQSSNMEIFDFLSAPEFDKLMDDANLIITHGGAGTILSAIKKGKKVIAAPRLSKYMEHHNDHQKQIISEFSKEGYILPLYDFSKLGKLISKSNNFHPKKFESNTKNMDKLIEKYILDDNHISWLNNCFDGFSYLFFGFCTTIINFLIFYILRIIGSSIFISNTIAWILAVLFAFLSNKFFVFKSTNSSRNNTFKEVSLFFICRIISYFFDIGFLYLFVYYFHISDLISKIISNIIVIIVNYIFSKVFIFKGEKNDYEK